MLRASLTLLTITSPALLQALVWTVRQARCEGAHSCPQLSCVSDHPNLHAGCEAHVSPNGPLESGSCLSPTPNAHVHLKYSL